MKVKTLSTIPWLAITTWSSLTCLAAPTTSSKSVDVVVVGGGLSGLAAARKLLDAGKSVAVLEARDRVGGRVENENLKNGGVIELGAAFVGPTQDHVLALAEELQLDAFLEYNQGSNLLSFGNQSLLVPSQGGWLSGLDSQTTDELAAIDAMAASIDVHSPWTHPNASIWDGMTFGTWIEESISNKTVQALLQVSTAAIWAANPQELSFLYVLAYIASAGNQTTTGTILRLAGTANGAQERRIEGGTGLLATGLAGKIGWDKISLNSPVHSITQTSDGNQCITINGSTAITGKKVIVGMSPPLAARVRYEPPLPASRDQLSQRMFMGALGKASAIYSTPFWRNDNLSGQVVSTSGTIHTTFDISPANASYGAILGFVEADEMRSLDAVSTADEQALVQKDYVRYFGPKAANATQWLFKRWDNDVYSRGGPTALAGPGTLTGYGKAITEPCGDIHWAGTEGSPYWTGYMDGAIRSGERAAREVLLAL